MVRQYPYNLFSASAGGTKNANGDYVAGNTVLALVSVCRDEVNGAGDTVTLADSTEQVYDWVIFAPLSCPPIARGTAVEVRQGTAVRVKGTVKRFDTGQLHVRIWV